MLMPDKKHAALKAEARPKAPVKTDSKAAPEGVKVAKDPTYNAADYANASSEERKKLEKWSRSYEAKRRLKQVWRFIWYDDSLASWIVNVMLGWALGTSFPIVAVVSSSMEHPGDFNDWWGSQCSLANGNPVTQEALYARYGIDKAGFGQYGFTNGFDRGDLMVLQSAQDTEIGDVLVFSAPGFSDPIIHRIVAKRIDTQGRTVFETKGDHNCGQGPYEQSITPERVFGKAVLRVPWLGWIKIGFVNLVMYVKCAFTPQAADCALWRGLR
jgi:hypothetical protein